MKHQPKTLLSNFGQIKTEKFSAVFSEYQADHKQTWHSHDEFVLAMTLKGNVREEVKTNDKLIEPFEVGVKSPEVRHRDYFCPKGVRVIRISVSPEFVAELKDHSLINEDWYWIKGSNAVRPFLRIGLSLLFQNAEIEDDVYDIFASISPPNNSSTNAPPAWLKQAKQQIDETFADGVRL
jgi:hypothetical protein